MGLSFAGLAWLYGPNPILLVALSLFFLLWILTLIDLETWLLPNALTFPGIALGLAFSWWFGYLQDALIGAVAGYKVFKQSVEGGRFQHLVGDQHTSDSRLTSGGQWYTRRLCQPIVVP